MILHIFDDIFQDFVLDRHILITLYFLLIKFLLT